MEVVARWPIRPILGFSGSKVPQKWDISCLGRRWTAAQNLTPLALSSAEKSVTVQTNKQKHTQTVTDISTPCLSACVDKKRLLLISQDCSLYQRNEIHSRRFSLWLQTLFIEFVQWLFITLRLHWKCECVLKVRSRTFVASVARPLVSRPTSLLTVANTLALSHSPAITVPERSSARSDVTCRVICACNITVNNTRDVTLTFAFQGRLLRVDLIKWVWNICPPVRPSVHKKFIRF